MRPFWFSLLLLPVLAGMAGAEETTASELFAEKLGQIKQACRYSPQAAWKLAQSQGLLPGMVDDRWESNELTLALAPAIALQKGYEATRADLQGILVAALMSPTPDDVVVRIQTALADLDCRFGEFESGLFQFLEGLKATGPETSDPTRFHLLESGIQASLLLGRPFLARELLRQLDALGGFQDPECKAASHLLLAITEGQCGNIEDMHIVLEKIETEPGILFREDVLKQFWLLKANLDLLTARPVLVERFLEEAASANEGLEHSSTEGWLFWYKAVHGAWVGLDDGILRQYLDKAAQAFRESGRPGTYAALLAGYARQYLGGARDPVPAPLLEELASFAFREGQSSVVAYGHAARGELLARSGELDDAYQAARQCYGILGKVKARIDRLEADWDIYRPNLVEQEEVAEPKSYFYTILLVLLLTILVLVLFLRVRTQRHVNERLRESVEKSRVAEEAAEHASRLKSQFVSNISHEIKAPMSGLVGMASILDELVTDPAQRKYLDTIRVCSRNLLVLMDDLLDLGRMESGRLEMEEEPFRPAEIFSYCEQLALRPAQAKGLQLNLKIDDTVPDFVIGDSTRFGQILTNLLNNAIKYTREGHVRLAARYEKVVGNSGRMIIDISDTGVGISAGKLNTVFEPFNQSGHETSEEADGNGLGLAISKRLVDLMSGSIMVVSEEGKGSTFTVTIPFNEHFENPESA